MFLSPSHQNQRRSARASLSKSFKLYILDSDISFVSTRRPSTDSISPPFFDKVESELSQQTQSTKPPNHSAHLATKTPTTQPIKKLANPANFSKKEEEETKPQIIKQNIKQPHPLKHTLIHHLLL